MTDPELYCTLEDSEGHHLADSRVGERVSSIVLHGLLIQFSHKQHPVNCAEEHGSWESS